jgi:hypothetical protein
MLTRRRFLLGSVALGLFPFAGAYAKKARVVQHGLRQIARLSWPPAIVPDHASIVDKGFACFTDEFGNLAIVDLKRASDAKVVGELHGLGKKVSDACILPHKAYILALQESAQGDAQYMLVSISLAPANEPSIISSIALSQFSEASSVVAEGEVIAVGGLSTNGENLVSIYAESARRARPSEPVLSGNFTVALPVAKLSIEDNSLLVLETNRVNSQIDYVNLYNPHSPQVLHPTKLSGEMTALARAKDMILVGGLNDEGKCQVTLITTVPAPHTVQSVELPHITQVDDLAFNRYQALVLGEQKTGQVIVPVDIGKKLEIEAGDAVALPIKQKLTGGKPKLALRDRGAYIAAGWAGAEVVSFNNKDGWHHDFTFPIPHLVAAGVAAWGNLAVLAAADLKLYDITRPDKPTLVKTADPGGTVKALAGAGSYVLCLTKDMLSLRKMVNIDQIVAQAQISAHQVAFDQKNQMSYVLKEEEKKTIIYPVKTYSDRLEMGSAFEAPAGFRRLAAHGGILALGGLNDLALYNAGEKIELIGTHHFDNMAIRDLAVTDEYLLVTAVNPDSKGFLLVLDKEGKDLPLLGTLDLPHDGVALSALGEQAITIGRTADGADLATVVNIKDSAAPKLVASVPALEAASAVTLNNNLAIVVGRGLEILSLS